MSVADAKPFLAEKLRSGWLMAINGNMPKTGAKAEAINNLKESDVVTTYPAISGG